jgi:ribosomal protein L2
MHTFVSYTMGMVRRDIFYIPEGAIIGDTIVSGTKVPISMGNALPLSAV